MLDDKELYYDDDETGYDEDDRLDYTLEDALAALPLKETGLVPMQIVLGFSDMIPQQLEQVRPVWQKLPAAQRQIIMARMTEASEADYILDYAVFATLGYDDPDAMVRASAIQAGWTDESPETLNILMRLAKQDAAAEVRAAAVTQLGQFIAMGAMTEIDKKYTKPAEDLALAILKDPNETPDLKRCALEAIAHCSRPGVEKIIQQAYEADDLLMKISAVRAMGNTADMMWEEQILLELDSEENEIRFEAARSSGALGLKSAIEKLIDLGYDKDAQVQQAAVWSLGEIGGDDAYNALLELDIFAQEEGDDDLIDIIDEALTMVTIISEMSDFDLLAFPDDEDIDEDELDGEYDKDNL